MSVIAKFHVTSLTTSHIDGGSVKLSAVSRGDRNAQWAQASPSGTIEMACSESEFQFWLEMRDRARIAQDFQKRLCAERTAATGVEHRLPHVGIEVFVTMSREPINGSITRLMNLDSVSRPQPVVDAGNCAWTSINGGGYTVKNIYINNPTAYCVMADAFQHGKVEWYLAITPSLDGYPGDGHEFRESVYPAGIWGHGLCGQCFGKPEDH